MKKSYVLVEVTHTMDGEKMNVLAGTESKTCALRVLDAFKAYNADCAKRGVVSDTIIRSSVIDNPEYSASLNDTVEMNPGSSLDRLLSMVDVDET